MATADSRDNVYRITCGIVLVYDPVGTAKFTDGRGGVVVLDSYYGIDRESRMQALHDQLANLQVTVAEKYDPARRKVQELRRVCAGLGVLGEVVL